MLIKIDTGYQSHCANIRECLAVRFEAGSTVLSFYFMNLQKQIMMLLYKQNHLKMS
jgi:hypothetical protein